MSKASITTSVTATTRKGSTVIMEDTSNHDEGIPGIPAGTSVVHSGVTLRFSEALRYGTGNWDRVPFVVEVRSDATITCAREEDAIADAQGYTWDLALQHAQDKADAGLDAVADFVTSRFSHLFADAEEE